MKLTSPSTQNPCQQVHLVRVLFAMNLCGPQVVEGIGAIQLFESDVLA
jgi:hypothetical protein